MQNKTTTMPKPWSKNFVKLKKQWESKLARNRAGLKFPDKTVAMPSLKKLTGASTQRLK
jgi:hypothetical protein